MEQLHRYCDSYTSRLKFWHRVHPIRVADVYISLPPCLDHMLFTLSRSTGMASHSCRETWSCRPIFRVIRRASKLCKEAGGGHSNRSGMCQATSTNMTKRSNDSVLNTNNLTSQHRRISIVKRRRVLSLLCAWWMMIMWTTCYGFYGCYGCYLQCAMSSLKKSYLVIPEMQWPRCL